MSVFINLAGVEASTQGAATIGPNNNTFSVFVVTHVGNLHNIALIGLSTTSEITVPIMSEFGGQEVVSIEGLLATYFPLPGQSGITSAGKFGNIGLIGQTVTTNLGLFSNAFSFLTGQSTKTIINVLDGLYLNGQSAITNTNNFPNSVYFLKSDTTVADIGAFQREFVLGQSVLTENGQSSVGTNIGLGVLTSVGAPNIPNILSPSGMSISSNIGDLSFTKSPRLIGQNVSSYYGLFSNPTTPKLIGQYISADAGRLLRFPVGQQIISNIGAFTNKSSIIGLHIISSSGTISPINLGFIGQQVISSMGRLLRFPIGQQVISNLGLLRRPAQALKGQITTTSINLLNYRIFVKTNMIGQLATTFSNLSNRLITEGFKGLSINSNYSDFINITKITNINLVGEQIVAGLGLLKSYLPLKLIGQTTFTTFNEFKNITPVTTSGLFASSQRGSLVEAFYTLGVGNYITPQIGIMTSQQQSKILMGMAAFSLNGNIGKISGHINSIGIVTSLGNITSDLQRNFIGNHITSQTGYLYGAKGISGVTATLEINSMPISLEVFLTGQDVITHYSRMPRLNNIVGLPVITNIGFFRNNNKTINGVSIISTLGSYNVRLVLSKGISATSLISSFTSKTLVSLSGQIVFSDISKFLSIFNGVFVNTRIGEIGVAISYPPYLKRTLPPYKLMSIHDTFTNRNDNSDPTDSFEFQRRDVGKYITHNINSDYE